MKQSTVAFVCDAWLFMKKTTVWMNRSMFRQLSDGVLLWMLLSGTAVQAQIVPDGTLGGERSTIVPRLSGGGQIRGGAIRGSNLFHSFSDFNIGDGAQVYFANPIGIQNILTRVTGGNASNINGTLGVDGTANLFLLNPNGILFGQNARLDVRGSFVGSTANGIQFGTQGEFSATNPQAPPLLTVQPSALLFSQIQGGEIVNRSQSDDRSGLSVPTGKSLLLVGGNVVSDGGNINVPGGRVELGGLAEPGSVALINQSDRWQLGFPTGVQRSDITLQNQGSILNTGGLDDIVLTGRNITVKDTPISSVLVRGVGTSERRVGNFIADATGNASFDYSNTQGNRLENASIEDVGSERITAENIFLTRTLIGGTASKGAALNASGLISLDSSFIQAGRNPQTREATGNINITARNLNLTNGSSISTGGIATTGDAGKVTLNVLDTLLLTGKSQIGTNGTPSGGFLSGKSGDIEIQARAIVLEGQGNLISTFSRGTSAGDVRINADTITLNGGAINSISNEAANGGNIDIQSRFVSLVNGGTILTGSSGAGNSGNLTINASDAIEVKGSSEASSSFLSTSSFGSGSAGQLTLNTGKLSILEGGFVSSGVGDGKRGGDIIINATGLVEIAGRDAQGRVSSLTSGSLGVGDSGNILINANRLRIRDSAYVTAFSTQENAPSRPGSITINAPHSVEIIGGSLAADTSSDGDAGKITIRTGALTLIDGYLRSGAFGTGNANGGDIEIEAQGVSVLNGSTISADAFNNGRSGNLTITGSDFINVSGESLGEPITTPDGTFSKTSDISNQVDGSGVGGRLTLNTKRLTVADGAWITTGAGSESSGRGGALTINASELVDVYGETKDGQFRSFITASTLGTADAGNITINTGRLRIRDGAFITTSNRISDSTAKSGDITIRAQNGIEIGGRSKDGQNFSQISSGTVSSGRAGNIDLQSESVSIVDGAIFSDTSGKGRGGDVRMNVGSLMVSPGGIYASTLGQGDAGNVDITARDRVSLSGIDLDGFVSAITVSSTPGSTGKPGDLTISANSVQLADGAFFSATTGNDKPGGNITVNANTIQATGGGLIQSSTRGSGQAGNITLTARDRINFEGNYQNETESGSGVSVVSTGSGAAGSIFINAPLVRLSDNAIISARSSAADGGNITINAPDALVLRRNSRISTSAGTEQAPGNGGNITINAGSIVSKPNENNTIQANAFTGRGGNIAISANALLGLSPSSSLIPGQSTITASSQLGVQGQVTITQPQVQPTQGTIELPATVLDASNQLSQVCPRNSDLAKAASFVVSGAGSLPPNPMNPLAGTVEISPVVSLATLSSNRSVTTTPTKAPANPSEAIVEAQGWIKTSDGKVVLVAHTSETTAPIVAACPTPTQ